MVRPHTFYNSIGQERDRFIIPRLLTNRITELYEDEGQTTKKFQIIENSSRQGPKQMSNHLRTRIIETVSHGLGFSMGVETQVHIQVMK